LTPNCVIVAVDVKELRMYQTPADGRKTAMSVRLSPSKSAGVMMSDATPQFVVMFDPPLLGTMFHVAVLGRNVDTSDFPSPSKSKAARATRVITTSFPSPPI